MKRLASAVAILGLSLGGMLATAPAALADDYNCRGSVGARTLDNVKVPTGATCRLTGTRVKGNIKVQRGGTLIATSVRVEGNIQSEGHRNVTVQKTSVKGSIQTKQGAKVYLRSNTVNGDIQLFSNRSGQHYVALNRVGGNLQCKSNSPAVTGGKNVVKGNKEGQCRRL